MIIEFKKKWTNPSGRVFKKGSRADFCRDVGRELVKKKIAEEINEKKKITDGGIEWK